MEIIKITEIIGEKGGSELASIIETVGFYGSLAINAIFDLCGYDPGNERISDLAMIVLAITTPILIIRLLLKILIKMVALSAIYILLIGKIYPLPSYHLLLAAVLLSFGTMIFFRVLKR